MKADGASDEKVDVALKLYAMMAQGNTFAMKFMDEEVSGPDEEAMVRSMFDPLAKN
jgi:hypothetical protein